MATWGGSTSLEPHDRCYAWGGNVFCNVEFSWWRGQWGLCLVVYDERAQRNEYWLETLGM